MADMNEKVSALLSDPQSMEKIMAIAKSLGAGAPASLPAVQASATPAPPMADMALKLMPVMEAYTKSADDPKVKLLLALKPMVSAGKQKNIDDAVSMLRLTGVASKLFAKENE